MSQVLVIRPYAGYASLNNSTGNTMLGYSAGYTNTSGKYNTMVGMNAGFANSTGEHNIFVGRDADYNNRAGISSLLDRERVLTPVTENY